jgi:hypothetical protein
MVMPLPANGGSTSLQPEYTSARGHLTVFLDLFHSPSYYHL